MDANLKQSMFAYYDERAPEFEEIYMLGKGPASISDPDAYKAEVKTLSAIVAKTCAGNLIDIACGTAFWLPHYAAQCSHITLLDQSEAMLSESRKTVEFLGLEYKSSFISGDILNYKLDCSPFDCALIGFFISHLTDKQEQRFFQKLKSILKPHGKFLILDSVWNEARAKTRKQEGTQERVLNDGRRFQIYKKYFDKSDILSMQTKHRINLTIEHFGKVFLTLAGTFRKG